MFKKIINWVIYTLVMGILPLLISWLVCRIVKISIAYNMICAEIFFFNLTLLIDGLRELLDINQHKKLKAFFHGSIVVILVIVAVIYGVLLLNNYKADLKIDLGIDLMFTYGLSVLFTITSVILDVSIQIIGGVENG